MPTSCSIISSIATTRVPTPVAYPDYQRFPSVRACDEFTKNSALAAQSGAIAIVTGKGLHAVPRSA